MVTFLPSFTDQNRLHQGEGKTLEKVEATTLGWQILHKWRAPAREILRKFKIAKKTSLGHSDSNEIKKTRVRTRVQITSNKKYSYTILKIRKSQLGKHLYLTNKSDTWKY